MYGTFSATLYTMAVLKIRYELLKQNPTPSMHTPSDALF